MTATWTLELVPGDPESPMVEVVGGWGEAETFDVPDNFKFKLRVPDLDPAGIHKVDIDDVKNLLRVQWFAYVDYPRTAKCVEIYYGKHAVGLFDMVTQTHPLMRPTNAAELGFDLGLGEMALKKGLNVISRDI